MRITLNLATRPYADQGPALKQLRVGMAVLGVILAGLGLGMMHFHQSALRMAAQEAKLDQEVAKIRQEEQGYQAQMQQPANAKVLTQAGFLNQLFDEKSFSWTAAMEDLEPVLPAGVQVTAIEPNRAKDGTLTLRLHISGPRDRAVEMMRNMEHSRRFVSPRISGENSETNSSHGDLVPVGAPSKVSFEMLAEYSQATLDERKAALAARKTASGGSAKTAVPTPAAGPRPGYKPPNQRVLPGAIPAARPGARPDARPGMLPIRPGMPVTQPGMPQQLPLNPNQRPTRPQNPFNKQPVARPAPQPDGGNPQ